MAGIIVINDDNYQDFINPTIDGEVKMCATLPRREGFGALPFAAPSAVEPMTVEEIRDRAAELKRTKTRLSDMIKDAGFKSLNQNGTNYCWANGPINALRVARMLANQPYVDLSPASVAAPITGFRNVGGWGTEAMKWIAEKGAVPTEFWPANAIDRSYYTEENKKRALDFRVTEWDDIPARNWRLLATYCVLRIGAAVGYNWWGHEVYACDIDPDNLNGLIYNSWDETWGERGFGWLSQSKFTPDDACAPRVAIAA